MRLCNKLDFVRLEFFKIIKILEMVIYKLDLPDSMRIMRIRYILVLKLVDLEVFFIKMCLKLNLKAKKRFEKLKKY